MGSIYVRKNSYLRRFLKTFYINDESKGQKNTLRYIVNKNGSINYGIFCMSKSKYLTIQFKLQRAWLETFRVVKETVFSKTSAIYPI